MDNFVIKLKQNESNRDSSSTGKISSKMSFRDKLKKFVHKSAREEPSESAENCSTSLTTKKLMSSTKTEERLDESMRESDFDSRLGEEMLNKIGEENLRGNPGRKFCFCKRPRKFAF